jgi:hypothetical protein
VREAVGDIVGKSRDLIWGKGAGVVGSAAAIGIATTFEME